MPNCKFPTEFSKDALRIQAMQKNKGGKGWTAKVDYEGGNLFDGVKARVPFNIKPGMDETVITDYMKMNLMMELDPEDEAQYNMKRKLEELGDGVCDFMFKNKDKIFGDKAKFWKDVDSMRAMFTPVVKEGKASEEGRAYKPNFTIKVMGQAKKVDHLECEEKINKDGSKSQVVKSVVWKQDLDLSNKPTSGDCQFWLCTGTDDANGVVRDKITQYVNVKKADGTDLLDSNGEPVKRRVSAEDIRPGCYVKPLFSIDKVWYVQTFGVHLKLEGVRIYPPPPKPVAQFDDAVVDDSDDPLVTSRVLKEIEKRAEPEAAIELPRDEEHAEFVPTEKEIKDVEASPAGRKRKADDEAPKKKKAKTADEQL